MSKEDILAKYEYDVHYYGGGRKDILDAMDEYAKQVQFELAEFLDDNHYRRNKPSNKWFDNNFTFLTKDEVYELYIQNKNK